MSGNGQLQAKQVDPFDRSSPFLFLSLDLGGGNKQRVDVDTRFLEFHFTEGGKKSNKFKLTVADLDLKNSELKEFLRGMKIVMQWGYVGLPGPEYRGVIQKVKGNQKLVLEGLGKEVLMNKEQKSRLFENQKRSEVVKTILKENGYRDADLDIEDTEVTCEAIVQCGETDAQFIRSLAEEEDVEWGDDFDGFHFRRATFEVPPIREIVYFHSDVGEILKYEVDGSMATLPSQVSVKGIDPKTKQVVEGKGSNADTKRGGVAQRLNESATGDASSTLGMKYIKPVADSALAKRTADRAYIGASRANFKIKLELIGDPRNRSKVVCQISGIGKEESGRYYFNVCETSFKSAKFTNKVEGKSDAGQGDQSKAAKAPGAANPNQLTPVRKLDKTATGGFWDGMSAQEMRQNSGRAYPGRK